MNDHLFEYDPVKQPWNKVHFKSITCEWATPQWLFNELNKEFNFTLDVCADDTNYKCKQYFTEKSDGLRQSWQGNTFWCNPPYGRDVTGKWVAKAYQEWQLGQALGAMLLPGRIDTAWFHEYCLKATEIRAIKGRLKFGNSMDSAPFPSIIVIFRERKSDL